MYKGVKFEVRDVEEVQADIETAKDQYGDHVRTVFIGDSNSLVMRTDRLVQVLNTLCGSFPRVERVTSYARAKTLVKKTPEDLAKIRRAGLTRLHVGLETGDGDLLQAIGKGATPEEMVEAGKKAREAGFELSLYVLLGIGGEEQWRNHATGTAEVLNRIDPDFIRVRTFIPQPGSLLYDAAEEGVLPAGISRNHSEGNGTIDRETRSYLPVPERSHFQSSTPGREITGEKGGDAPEDRGSLEEVQGR